MSRNEHRMSGTDLFLPEPPASESCLCLGHPDREGIDACRRGIKPPGGCPATMHHRCGLPERCGDLNLESPFPGFEHNLNPLGSSPRHDLRWSERYRQMDCDHFFFSTRGMRLARTSLFDRSLSGPSPKFDGDKTGSHVEC